MTTNFWKNKVVLITGHTGFKGSWLSLWLQSLGAKVIGFSLPPPTIPSLFDKADVASGMISIEGDIRNLEHIKQVFNQYQPEIIFHFAAQSLVRKSYHTPIETYEVNVMGTLNLLEAARNIDSIRSMVLATTDKCYKNKEWIWAYRENEEMGGHDPYSSSKGCAELLIASYRESFFKTEKLDGNKTAIASVRSGNVIGGGDWADDRLIPDIIRAFQKNRPVTIRYPEALRPWQHVLEPLSGYLMLAEKLCTNGVDYSQAWNFGPLEQDIKPVKWIVQKMATIWGEETNWEIDEKEHLHEATYLKLDCSKAHNQLLWWPKWNLEYALKKIIDWHKAELKDESLRDLCLEQIHEYTHKVLQ